MNKNYGLFSLFVCTMTILSYAAQEYSWYAAQEPSIDAEITNKTNGPIYAAYCTSIRGFSTCDNNSTRKNILKEPIQAGEFNWKTMKVNPLKETRSRVGLVTKFFFFKPLTKAQEGEILTDNPNDLMTIYKDSIVTKTLPQNIGTICKEEDNKVIFTVTENKSGKLQVSVQDKRKCSVSKVTQSIKDTLRKAKIKFSGEK